MSPFPDLELLRRGYYLDIAELILGRAGLLYLEEKVREGGHRITIVNGSWRSEESLDKATFARHAMTPMNHTREAWQRLEKQTEIEYGYRRRVIRQHISGMGLAEHTDEIIYGLNKSAERVIVWPDTSARDLSEHEEVFFHDSDCMLEFGLDYVDRWKMYRDLFATEGER